MFQIVSAPHLKCKRAICVYTHLGGCLWFAWSFLKICFLFTLAMRIWSVRWKLCKDFFNGRPRSLGTSWGIEEPSDMNTLHERGRVGPSDHIGDVILFHWQILKE